MRAFQALDLALGEVSPLDCQVYDAWGAFLGCRFHAVNLACGCPTVKLVHIVPEIVTRGRFPDGGESDSTWRTQEARHVGSDTIAPGF